MAKTRPSRSLAQAVKTMMSIKLDGD